MRDQLLSLREEALRALAAASSEQQIEEIRVKYLGRKGRLTELLRGVKFLPAEERPAVGQVANTVKEGLAREIEAHQQRIREAATLKRISEERVDVTLPGRRPPRGSYHPLTLVTRQIVSVFQRMGFEAVEGPEVDRDFYNFEALNMPKDHPARDMQDTFYIDSDTVLRTHTSNVQIHTMMARKPPLRVIAPGTVYRCDSDQTHSPMFHQVEGFLVDRDVSFAELKGVLTAFVHALFSPDVPLRFRPSYFPFTEPSAEVDIGCFLCKGEGCRVCSHSGWIEILGSGMIHPEVFRMVGYEPGAYTGFAFGLGIERVAMLKYGIDDIRLFFENDTRFLEQF
ncbi:MAG: phenylalanine--tRNA ligase subunit alpha [bacterium]